MKLKTLKDIGTAFDKHGKTDAIIVSKEELKAEAIKWVKDFENRDKTPIAKCCKRLHWGLIGAHEEFMDFFNLTDEDLI